MFALNAYQLELLQRVSGGMPMWGGSLVTERLRREVELLLSLRLIEPARSCPYQLTTVGALVLEARRLSLEHR